MTDTADRPTTLRLPAAERRRQLLDVALHAFAEHGYHDTSMNDVAEAAGVTKPVLYQHCASKKALYQELALKRQFKGSFEDMAREIEGLVGQMSPEDRRRYLVESLFLNYNTYESEMLDAYARRLTARKKARGRAAGGGR